MNDKVKEAIASIDKKWGKGQIVSLTEKDKSVKRCSSGSLALDIALGGGYPYGRIIEIFGPESSGKCLSENSYILTDEGYKTVNEVFAEQRLELLTTCKDIEVSRPLVNKDLKLENTTHFTYNGKKPLYRIKTQSGYVLERTFKHPLLVLNEEGIVIWKWAGELEPGDSLLGPRNPEISFGKEHNPDAAYSLGLLIADGSLKGSQSISNDDPVVIDWILNKMPASLGIRETKVTKESPNVCGTTTLEISLMDKHLWEILHKWGLDKHSAKEKVVPVWIRKADKMTMAAFLRGYMDVESYINSSGLEVSSASERLLYEIKLMLSQFGIIGTLKPYWDKKYQRYYWTLLLTGNDFYKYLSEIGVSSTQKLEQISSITKKETKFGLDSYPNINKLIRSLFKMQDKRTDEFSALIEDLRTGKVNCSYRRLQEILKISEDCWLKNYLTTLLNYRVDIVESIEEIEPARTFDFAMEKTHSFVADGIVNHNTTIVLSAMVQAQKANPDKMVAYMDLEFAFDPVYAENLGLDLSPDKFVFVQPEHGEEVFDIIESLLKTGEFSFIAVDSVAAMVPRAEREGEIGEAKMGLHARLMSQGMRRLVGAISKSDTILYFTNQLRDNIGVIYGNPEVTTGGNALKFYASQRLDVRKTQTLKEGEVSYANNIRITVKKNKVAPPFGKCETMIEFGQGISLDAEIVNLAIDNGLIKKSGSWYVYENAKMQGLGQVIDLVKEDVGMKESLVKQIKEIYNLED